jgi:hypothetical protein
MSSLGAATKRWILQRLHSEMVHHIPVSYKLLFKTEDILPSTDLWLASNCNKFVLTWKYKIMQLFRNNPAVKWNSCEPWSLYDAFVLNSTFLCKHRFRGCRRCRMHRYVSALLFFFTYSMLPIHPLTHSPTMTHTQTHTMSHDPEPIPGGGSIPGPVWRSTLLITAI